MMRNYLELGSWNVVCDRCGYEYKHHQLQKEWTGLMVCRKCYEPRHPQTLIKAMATESVPSWTRPEPTDVFLVTGDALLTELLDTLYTENDLIIYTES